MKNIVCHFVLCLLAVLIAQLVSSIFSSFSPWTHLNREDIKNARWIRIKSTNLVEDNPMNIHTIINCAFWQEEFEDTKEVIKIRKSKKDRQHNNKKKKKNKRTNNDLQNTTQKTKDRTTRTPLKPGGELRCSGRVSSSCSISGTRRVTLVTNPVISQEDLIFHLIHICFALVDMWTFRSALKPQMQ